MAALDFPSSPTIGQVYTANGKSWQWDGTAWVSYNRIISIGVTGSSMTIYGSPVNFPDATSLVFTNSISVSCPSVSFNGNTTLGDAAGDTLTINAGTTTFAGTGQRITGDFSNATASNRVMFQSSTVNGGTSIGLMPNGTSTSTEFRLFSSNDTLNNSTMVLANNGAEVTIRSGISGTGTYLPLTFYTGGREAMRIGATSGSDLSTLGIGYTSLSGVGEYGLAVYGKVGIGTSSPAAKLDVASEIRVTSGTNIGRFLTDGSNFYVGTRANIPMRFETNSTTQMIIDTSGNVGIGAVPTAIPSTGNPVVGANNLIMYNAGNLGLTMLTDNAATRTQQLGFGSQGISLFDAGLKYDNTSRALAFWSSASEKMRLDSSGQCIWKPNGITSAMTLDASGNLVVGDTTSSGARFKVRLDQNGLTYYDLVNISNTSSAAAMQRFVTYNAAGTGTTSADIVKYKTGSWYFANNDGVIQMRAVSNGVELLSGATTWTTLSDEAEKDILDPITDSVTKLTSLRTVFGKYKSDSEGTRRPFLIAQDVQKVFPEVTPVLSSGKLGLDYSGMIPMLVKAIQELHAEIELLKAKVN